MESIEIAKEIILEVNEKVKRVYWTNEQINRYFGKRSAKEILDSKQTCFMNPCSDLTLVSSYFMSSKGIKHDLIIEEHAPAKDFNFDKSKLVIKDFDYRLHFGIDFLYKGEKWGIDYKRENEVYIIKGGYNGREDMPKISIIKMHGEEINPYRAIHKNLGYNSLEELIANKFKGFSLEKNISRLKQDNNLNNFKEYKKRNGDNFKIIIKSQNQL